MRRGRVALATTEQPTEECLVTTSVPLDATTLRDRLTSADPPKLVDVRTPAEYGSAHIDGAHNVPLDLLRAHVEELRTHLGDDVVLVCRSGPRAEQARQVLGGGRVLLDGMDGWDAAGGPVERGRQMWDMDRQVRFTAGLLVLLGLLASVVVPVLVWFSALIAGLLVLTATLGICPMADLLARMPWNRGRSAPDVRQVVAALG
jgi:rhodanese-related sulfurtransferase